MAEKNTNFMKKDQVFILDTLNPANTAELIADLADFVAHLPMQNPIESKNYKITNPYCLPGKTQPAVLDITINSTGGNSYSYQTIATLISRAKSMGAIVRTTVGGIAGSAASMLAVQGTPGFRIMYESAMNMIHWGAYSFTFDKDAEVDAMPTTIRGYKDKIHEIYLQFTDITPKKLKKMMTTETSYLMAQECLKLNICDWILTTDGKFIGRPHTR